MFERVLETVTLLIICGNAIFLLFTVGPKERYRQNHKNEKRVNMKKKRIISIAVILGILACAIVFAVQILSDVSKSTVTASNVKIEVVMLEEKEGEEVPFSGDTTIVPGETISRIAKVENTGKEAAWVRLKPVLVTGDETKPVSADTEKMKLDGLDEENWVKEGDYWYYQKPLEPGETSEPLFKSVIISDSIDGTFDGANLKVDAEGTQVKNNGSMVSEAQGWPSN